MYVLALSPVKGGKYKTAFQYTQSTCTLLILHRCLTCSTCAHTRLCCTCACWYVCVPYSPRFPLCLLSVNRPVDGFQAPPLPPSFVNPLGQRYFERIRSHVPHSTQKTSTFSKCKSNNNTALPASKIICYFYYLLQFLYVGGCICGCLCTAFPPVIEEDLGGCGTDILLVDLAVR